MRLFDIHIETIAVHIGVAFDIDHMHQIEQIETAVMVPAGFRAVHLPERAYAIDTCRPDALRHVEQTIRPKRYAASLQPLSIGTVSYTHLIERFCASEYERS